MKHIGSSGKPVRTGRRQPKQRKELMHKINAVIEIIGINPFVFVPDSVLNELFKKNGKNRGPVPIKGTINAKPFRQTLVKYSGTWRLYVNTKMLKNSPERIGESVELFIEFDPSDRSIPPHPRLTEALRNHPEAKEKFDALSPSMQKEIVRYIASLKTETSVDRNIKRAINFLLGKESFVGRKPLE